MGTTFSGSMLLQKFLSRKKLSRKKLSIFVSKIGPATGVRAWSRQVSTSSIGLRMMNLTPETPPLSVP